MQWTDQQKQQYIASQQKRYNDAYTAGDKGLQQRLVADLKRFNYVPLAPKPVAKPATPVVKPATPATNGVPVTTPATNGVPVVKPATPATTGTTVIDNTKKVDTTPATTTGSTPSAQDTTSSPVPVQPPKLNGFNNAYNYNYLQDPQYLQALAAARANAENTSKRSRMAVLNELNDRGMADSSYATTQMQQVTDDAMFKAEADIQNNLVPQLISQNYKQYEFAQQQKQDELAYALDEAYKFGHVTPRLAQLTGYHVGNPLSSEVKTNIQQQNANTNAQKADTAQQNADTNAGRLDETTRHNKAIEGIQRDANGVKWFNAQHAYDRTSNASASASRVINDIIKQKVFVHEGYDDNYNKIYQIYDEKGLINLVRSKKDLTASDKAYVLQSFNGSVPKDIADAAAKEQAGGTSTTVSSKSSVSSGNAKGTSTTPPVKKSAAQQIADESAKRASQSKPSTSSKPSSKSNNYAKGLVK